MKLNGKVAIVTGSSRGLGKAIALEFAREGADVVIAARTEVAKGIIAGTIGDTAAGVRALGRRALAIRCNLLDEEEIVKMVQRAVEEFGRIDILVNNAAVNIDKPLVETATKHWDIGMGVNVRAPYLCCREVIPIMAKQRAGSIVNLSSPVAEKLVMDAGGMSHRASTNYGATKAAIERLSLGLALEVAKHNIAVNAVKPAVATMTEGMAYMYPGTITGAGWAQPGDYLTKAAVFLAAQDAQGVTGRVVDDQTLCREFGL